MGIPDQFKYKEVVTSSNFQSNGMKSGLSIMTAIRIFETAGLSISFEMVIIPLYRKYTPLFKVKPVYLIY
jgi:hypothetical protein